ncbi:hypothetical protein SAMN04488518_11122 [Pseudovibrio ascidiaceicola]|uniref:Uncharacterized protein n=1 Tax=Pseudovibrio ascidiaceicola TaxID=285279 RepID=A0A1I4DBX7_9HYPH|nr:DUF6058 family natural product biosynthesis protein [Pseudovibrio ascidiaceicola]SFK89441.1 hypothetical protein SAMN04488518_11122 [Pseudovibrio ascidiaceicola]
MLLNYLYSEFYEEQVFQDLLGLSSADWQSLLERRVMPAASYLFTNSSLCVSFLGQFQERELYRFHLKSHRRWFEDLQCFGLTQEQAAKAFFLSRFRNAKEAFLAGELGSRLHASDPEVLSAFDGDLEERTWGHFLNGTYGICTRDGQPDTIFQKQVGVRFVENMTKTEPHLLSGEQLGLLRQTVDFLDGVESEFAPHEVAQSSRQRCIIDVREQYLAERVAA